jgi:hypothetical protein
LAPTMACDLMMPQPSVCAIPTPWVMTHVCQSPYVHNFIMHNGSPHMQIFLPMGIMCHAIPICIWGSRSIPVCIRRYQRSPYAYRDCMTHNPRMHTGIKINPRMHTGITEIPICIRGSHDTNPHMHMGICSIPVCIRGYFSH